MKILSPFLSSLHLDPSYCLLSVQGVALVLHYYKALDVRGEMVLDGKIIEATCNVKLHQMILLDLQFEVFLKSATDFNDMKVSMVFDMLDVDSSGIIDFDEFYLLICILIAVKV